jgi:hypothetical protein
MVPPPHDPDRRWAYGPPAAHPYANSRTPWQWVRLAVGWSLAVPGALGAGMVAMALPSVIDASDSCQHECYGYGFIVLAFVAALATGLVVALIGATLLFFDAQRHRNRLRHQRRLAAAWAPVPPGCQPHRPVPAPHHRPGGHHPGRSPTR